MIKEVMVRLDGTVADDVRLAAAGHLARMFEGYVIGLFLNVLPPPLPADTEGIGITQTELLMQEARQAGDTVEPLLTQRLKQLGAPTELRRFDILADEIPNVCAREARSSDTFLAIRPNSAPGDSEDVVERVLFGSGRHLFLVPRRERTAGALEHVLVAWNGSREAARALAEAMPYLHKASAVTICVVVEKTPDDVALGPDAGRHLERHGITATVHHVKLGKGGVGATLVAEARRLRADLMVMGGYGHSRLREWLLGGATYEVLHHAPVPLVIAH